MSIESLQGTGSAYQGSAQVKSSIQPEPKSQPVTSDSNHAEENPVVITNQIQNAMAQNSTTGSANGQEENTVQQSQKIKRAVSDINKSAKSTEAIFGIHDGTNRVTIKIVDKNTKKVIKEYPPEKTLDMIEKVWEMAGLMIDEKR